MNEHVEACVAYEHWASEIRRLTAAISDCTCPNESGRAGEGDGWHSVPSCFTTARTEEFPGVMPDDGPTRRNLDSIEKAVAACPACAQLCVLIRERKSARQQWGVAKRRIRVLGRRALAELATS